MVNTCLVETCGDPGQLLELLCSEHCGVEHVQAHEALQYLSVLSTLRAAKAEVGKG